MTEDNLRIVLQRIGIQVVRERNNNLYACCPAHDERRPSWGIRLDAPHFHGCFACGYKGSLYNLLVDKGGVSHAEARALCEIDAKIEVSSLVVEPPAPPRINEFELYPYEMEGEGLRYMTEDRGVRRRTLKNAGVVYDTKGKRVLFPWFQDNELLAVTGRTVDPNIEDNYKIISYFETRKGVTLYMPNRRITSEPLILVEGEIDCLKVMQTGFPNVAALGQGQLTKSQKNLVLKSAAQTIVIFTDDDPTGDRIAADMYEAFKEAKIVLQVDYTRFRGPERLKKSDPGGLRPEVVQMLVATATGKIFNDWKRLRR